MRMTLSRGSSLLSDKIEVVNGSVLPSPHPTIRVDQEEQVCSSKRKKYMYRRGGRFPRRSAKSSPVATSTLVIRALVHFPQQSLRIDCSISPMSDVEKETKKHRNGGDGADDEPPLEGYERTDMIGQGAYGIVYKGKKQDTGDIVAIKRIPFADSTPEGGVPCNVIREISLLRELDHPNVVKLFDIIQAHPGGLYLVFEYVAHDLKTFMDQHQTSDDIADRVGLPQPTVKNFLRQIIAGVGCCHTYRILHRDLKPHNLLISADGKHVKLADFGLARLSAIPNGPYTFEVVTLWYRAPELLLGANRYSTSVDVWSIGCIFAEMATGMPLFPGRSDIDQIFKIFQRKGTPTSEIWPAVTRLPHYNAEFPQWRERPITEHVPVSALGSNNAVDLLTKLLMYDPDRRIACKTALQHPYFFE